MIRPLSYQRALFGTLVMMSLMGILIALCFQMGGPSTWLVVQFSPRQGDDPAAVQLEPPSEEVNLDGDGIVPEEVDESGWVEPGNPDSIPLLIRYLKRENEIVQLSALEEFAGMGLKARKAVPAIVEALQDPKSSIRVNAAVTLIQMNVQARAASSALAKELLSDDATARTRATDAIDQLVNPPEVLGTSCWGPDPPPRIARPWVRKAVEQAVNQGKRD
jgi:HEAT repeat protein